ncbi:MAG: Elongation factor 2 [Chaenotheca gracillima]|nr:MAG: Elongation factor 2 [Chaenotheca gracillima]
MVLQFLSAYADEVIVQRLLPAISCCVPLGRDREEEDDEYFPDGREKQRDVYESQLDLTPPPRLEPLAERPGSLSSLSFPQWMARSQIFSSRTTSWATSSGKARTKSMDSGFPAISGPTDFKKVDGFTERPAGFRPLQLSIYLPNNRLSPLPDFASPVEESTDLEYPAPAYAASRTMSYVSSRTSSEFRIPRKPVGSGIGFPSPLSGRESFEVGFSPSTGTVTSEWVSQPLRPRPSLQDPISPRVGLSSGVASSYQPRLRTRSNTEPIRVLRRRDAEQCLRVRLSSEEAQLADGVTRNIDTIQEERRSVLVDEDFGTTRESIVGSQIACEANSQETVDSSAEVHRARPTRSFTFSDLSSLQHRPLPPTPMNFLQPNPLGNPAPPPPPPKNPSVRPSSTSPSLAVLQRSIFQKPSVSRVTKWLFTSATEAEKGNDDSDQPISLVHVDEKEVAVRSAAMSPTMSTISSAESVNDSHLPSSVTALSTIERSSSRTHTWSGSSRGHSRKVSEALSFYACPAYQEVDPRKHEIAPKPQVGLAF